MLSSSRFGLMAAVVSSPWQQKIIISRILLQRSSPSNSRPPSLSTPQSCNPVRPILRISSSFNASSHSVSPHQSSSYLCNSSCLQQRRKGSSRRTHSVSILSINSFPKFSTLRTGGAPSTLSSPLCCPSVILTRLGVGHQQWQLRNRRTRRRSQLKNTILVKAIASIDDPETDLNQQDSLHEELQRYGVHESDYTYRKVEPQDPTFSTFSKLMKDHRPTRGNSSSSSMPTKRKATEEMTNGTKQQHTPSKGKSEAVQDWCCYLLLSGDSKKTYVGVSFDVRRRLRQHNGEIAGGAKSCRPGRPWRLVYTIQGFHSRNEACQFEWKWKSTAAKYRVVVHQESETTESPLLTRRRETLAKVLKSKEEWTKLNIQWHGD
ncbi:unnamed protein product [Calypogeia fissa]